ncbi:MAG: histidine phosphatase family protein [Myxococcales bacterium]|nr:histidine phosphatase family protein [Myxococcales bacterium]
MAILLIRHGETDSNRQRIVQLPETPLSERGLEQAELLAARLAGTGVARVLSSDLARARMTAEAVARRSGVPLELDASLQERNFGDLRGHSYRELGIDFMAPGYDPPSGESWEAFHARVNRAWSQVRAASERTDGDLAVVSHGLVCYSLALRHFSLGVHGTETPRSWSNTGVTVVDAGPPWEVRLLDCTAHLDGTDAQAGGVSGL